LESARRRALTTSSDAVHPRDDDRKGARSRLGESAAGGQIPAAGHYSDVRDTRWSAHRGPGTISISTGATNDDLGGSGIRVYARLRLASIAPSSQMLCLRVSGITKIAIRNMTAGTTMG
jgi:hypothetical protein